MKHDQYNWSSLIPPKYNYHKETRDVLCVHLDLQKGGFQLVKRPTGLTHWWKKEDRGLEQWLMLLSKNLTSLWNQKSSVYISASL